MIIEAVKERLGGLNNLKNIHNQEGNWDHNDYMTGFYDGLEIAIAALEGREPQIKNKEGMK